jgi:hypothetical protein
MAISKMGIRRNESIQIKKDDRKYSRSYLTFTWNPNDKKIQDFTEFAGLGRDFAEKVDKNEAEGAAFLNRVQNFLEDLMYGNYSTIPSDVKEWEESDAENLQGMLKAYDAHKRQKEAEAKAEAQKKK